MVAHRYSCDYGGVREVGRKSVRKQLQRTWPALVKVTRSVWLAQPLFPICLSAHIPPCLAHTLYCFLLFFLLPLPHPPSSIRFGFCQFEMRFVIHILHENAKRQSVINCLKKRQHGVRAAGGADSRFTCLKFIFKRAVLAGWRGGRGTNTIKTDIKMPEKYTFFSILTGCASCLTGAEAVCVCVGICVSVCWCVYNTQVKLLNHSYSTCI